MKPSNPFKGLSPYTAKDANKFWGRPKETEALADYASTRKLLVVYGKSGVGKTSLLQAGVIPRLQMDGFFSAYARIDKDPIDAIQRQVMEAFQASGSGAPSRAENLSSFFENAEECLKRTSGRDGQETPIVLVLDQFEDFFGTFHKNGVEESRRKFTNQVAQVIYRKSLPVTFLFSMREDFLPEMDYFRATVPFILNNHYRLASLTLEAARTVITKTLEETSYHFEDDLIDTVLRDLEKSGDGGIEPYALQIVCSEIWERWDSEAKAITLDFYAKRLQGMQNILGSFVTKKVEEFPVQHQQAIKNIFAELFTDRGRGRLVHVSSLYEVVKQDVSSEQELVEKILEPLDKEYRLLTIRSIRSVLYCEPVHDALSQKANEWRTERERKYLEKKLREEHSRKRKKILITGAILALSMSLLVVLARIVAANVPWGFLVDLRTSQVYKLKAEKVDIGRDSKFNIDHREFIIRNNISFSNTLVSRHHAYLRRDRSFEDLRSRNGTSVNAALLPYGLPEKLSDGDIIVLGNVEALQFKERKSPSLPAIPPGTWAIFINGAARSYQFLTDSAYSVIMKDGTLSIEPGLSQSALMELHWSGNKAEMFEASDEWHVVYTLKETDYDYKSYILRSAVWMEMPVIPMEYVKLSPDLKEELQEGPKFQVVLLSDQPPQK